jgi:hypothetical protein
MLAPLVDHAGEAAGALAAAVAGPLSGMQVEQVQQAGAKVPANIWKMMGQKATNFSTENTSVVSYLHKTDSKARISGRSRVAPAERSTFKKFLASAWRFMLPAGLTNSAKTIGRVLACATCMPRCRPTSAAAPT